MYREEIPYRERKPESTRAVRLEYWEMAKGLQKVDGLTTSQYLESVAREHIEGRTTADEAVESVRRYYDQAGSMGIAVTNEPFRENVVFFRDALVRSVCHELS